MLGRGTLFVLIALGFFSQRRRNSSIADHISLRSARFARDIKKATRRWWSKRRRGSCERECARDIFTHISMRACSLSSTRAEPPCLCLTQIVEPELKTASLSVHFFVIFLSARCCFFALFSVL